MTHWAFWGSGSGIGIVTSTPQGSLSNLRGDGNEASLDGCRYGDVRLGFAMD
jgi:hypothetical protein